MIAELGAVERGLDLCVHLLFHATRDLPAWTDADSREGGVLPTRALPATSRLVVPGDTDGSNCRTLRREPPCPDVPIPCIQTSGWPTLTQIDRGTTEARHDWAREHASAPLRHAALVLRRPRG
jgi:hypothetical protein